MKPENQPKLLSSKNEKQLVLSDEQIRALQKACADFNQFIKCKS